MAATDPRVEQTDPSPSGDECIQGTIPCTASVLPSSVASCTIPGTILYFSSIDYTSMLFRPPAYMSAQWVNRLPLQKTSQTNDMQIVPKNAVVVLKGLNGVWALNAILA